MTVSNISTSSTYKMHSERNTTWSRVPQYSSLDLMRLQELSKAEVTLEVQVRELIHSLASIPNVKRVRAIAPGFPDPHWIDIELELHPETELSHEAWNNVQDLVIDYEWELRDISGEKWYFDPQVVTRFSPLQDETKVIADSEDRQLADVRKRTWSSPPLKLVLMTSSQASKEK